VGQIVRFKNFADEGVKGQVWVRDDTDAVAGGGWLTPPGKLISLTVILNGTKVLDNVTLEAITGGALDSNESEPGPIMLQGDHEKVWYRKVTVTPITDARK